MIILGFYSNVDCNSAGNGDIIAIGYVDVPKGTVCPRN